MVEPMKALPMPPKGVSLWRKENSSWP